MEIGNPFDNTDSFPDLTPLVDMMFLLLVFFMLTTTFDTETRDKMIAVDLPQAHHSRVVSRDRAVVISVSENGAFEIDDRACSAEMLPDVLRIRAVADSTVIISGHKNAPYQSIVYIYDVLQSLGLSRFAHDVR